MVRAHRFFVRWKVNFYMNISFFIFSIIFISQSFFTPQLVCTEIAPYKFTDEDAASGMPEYTIPASSRYTTQRIYTNAPDIVYYLSKPHVESYPIAIMCTGSSDKETIHSVIHIHRYFLQELLDLGAAVLTVEQWGVDGSIIDQKEYMDHYTRSQRLEDHVTVIETLKKNPPAGWNGKLVFIGVSEGGPIVTRLTELYSDDTIATINWSGAGDWSWRDELWQFLCGRCLHQVALHDCVTCFGSAMSRELYDDSMDATLQDPSSDLYFLNMTHRYHADALMYSKPEYERLRTPFLVVAGAQDSIIQSCDLFIQKARSAGVPITYIRVEDMDHYVRRRPDILDKSFAWLSDHIKNVNSMFSDC